MKVAIMQPYLFPYLGYYSLIKNTDYFVFFDTPQYIRKGWINRNRISDGKGDCVYITVPIEKTARETSINEILISQKSNWREKIAGQLTVYKKRAPYYKQVRSLIDDVFSYEGNSISELAIRSITGVCQYLDMEIKYDVFSKMNMSHISVNAPDEWALYITKELGFDTYVNPPGGKSFFDNNKYKNENIELEFLTQELIAYNQRQGGFVPGLSIIDVLMFCEPKVVLSMLEHYVIEQGEETAI